MVPFESLGAVFVSPSIVTMALSCIIYEIERGIFSYPLAFDDPVRGGGSPSEYCHPVWCGKTRMVGLPRWCKNCEDMYNRLDSILAL